MLKRRAVFTLLAVVFALQAMPAAALGQDKGSESGVGELWREFPLEDAPPKRADPGPAARVTESAKDAAAQVAGDFRLAVVGLLLAAVAGIVAGLSGRLTRRGSRASAA